MTEPIKAGDTCIVVGGAQGKHASNLGREVVVLYLMGEHSRFGRIWRCRTTDEKPLERIDGTFVEEGSVLAAEADFAAAWLQKTTPPAPKATDTTRQLEHT